MNKLECPVTQLLMFEQSGDKPQANGGREILQGSWSRLGGGHGVLQLDMPLGLKLHHLVPRRLLKGCGQDLPRSQFWDQECVCEVLPRALARSGSRALELFQLEMA